MASLKDLIVMGPARFLDKLYGNLEGNATSATKLQTSRAINGTNFDGTTAITTANWGTARNFTIGNSTKSVNGSQAMSWSLAEIGAVAKAGDTMTGNLTGITKNSSWIGITRRGAFRTETAASGGSANAVISMKTASGSWAIGNLTDSNNLYFVFGTDENYSAGTNSTSNYYITTGGAFSGSAATLTTARNINGTSFNGSADITTSKWGTARNIYIQDSDGSNTGAAVSVNGGANATLKLPATIKASLSGNADTATTATYALKLQTYKYNSTQTYGTSYPLYAQWNQQGNILLLKCDNYTVNTDTATKLATARTINGTSFDGSSNITTANWGTARTLTIGNKGQSVNGSGNVSWSLQDIGTLALDGSTHYVSLTAGDGNTTGYRLIGQSNITTWVNKRIFFIVSSRHTGNGLVTINYGCNSSTLSAENCYCTIRYFGTSKNDDGYAIAEDSFVAHVSSDGAVMYFFWKYSDYNSTYITVLKNNSAFTPSNGTWMTSINTSTYGSQIATTVINRADSVYDAYADKSITFAYSQAGLSTTNWFAAWNGYELRGISPVNSRITMSALSATNANGFYGMGTPDGTTSAWIRTTTLGIIPYQSGGYSALGTESWPFNNAYINTVYGNLSGNASTATALTTSAGSAAQAIYFSGGKPVAIDWHIGNANVGEHNCNNITYNMIGYYTSNGPTTSLGATTSDGSIYSQAYSSSWVSQIAQDYRDGALFVRGKNNGTWTNWLAILDSSNYTSYTVTKTGSGASGTWSINVTGSAGSVAWGNVTGKPGSNFVAYYNSSSAMTTTESVSAESYIHTVGASGGSVTTTTKPSGMDNAWGIIHLHLHSGNYGMQLGFGGTTGHLYQRHAYNSATFGAWKTILDSSNYTSYTVTKTGSGASGTWGIGITGNAATATAFSSNRTIALTGDVTGSASTNGSSGWSISTTVADDSHNHIISNVDGLQTALNNKAGGSNYIDITVGGDANTYYPVVLSGIASYYPMQFVNISRTYSETAPDTWNNTTHKGGLTMTLLWNGSRYWDGNGSGDPCYCVYLYQSYSTMVGGLGNSTSGIVVWLRGGTATYHIHSLNGKAMSATVYTSTYTDSASNSFAPTTTPEAVTVKWPGSITGHAATAGSASVATEARYLDYTKRHYANSSYTSGRGNRFFIRQYVNKSSSSTSSTDCTYYEQYNLPMPTPGRSSNTSYTILTSKSDVAVSQGGTGASTAGVNAGQALYNLGLIYSATAPETPTAGMVWLKPV